MIRHFFRALVWVFLRIVYRVRITGLYRIPSDGAAVLTPNHVSFLDAVLIASHIRRPIRFAMYWKLYRPFSFILGPLGAFPISSRDENPEAYARAFEIMAETIQNGELLCIFPEGQLTRDGQVGEFRGGVAKLLSTHPCRVIPVGLTNLWGSYFSRRKPGWFKLPDHFFAKIGMRIGEPLPADSSPDEIRQAVISLL